MPAPLKSNTTVDADLLIEPESQDDSQTSSGKGAANETTAPTSAADCTEGRAKMRAILERPRVAKGAETDVLNDAEILGLPDLMGDILDRPATLLLGEMWGAKDRRNTQDGKWTPVTMTWAEWIMGRPKTENTAAWGFSRHPVGNDKAGACIVLGSSVGGARKALAMDKMYAMGLDIDSGAKLDDVLDKVEASGLFCLVYSSHSHGKRGLVIKRDDVLKKLGISVDPTLAQIKEYLSVNAKDRYEADFIAAVTIKEARKQTSKGVMIALDTPPLEKFRLIFPLETPVKLIDLAQTHAAALDAWENAITGLAQNHFGIAFDTSCTDPSRLFYTARHPKKAEDYYCAVIRGRPLKFEDVKPMKKSTYTATRNTNLSAWDLAGGAHDGDRPPQALTPKGVSLNDWHTNVKDRFMMADFLESVCPERIRHAGGEASGHVHVECPFEGEHSSEGGTACMAINAPDSQHGYWAWFCRHDSCQGRHKTAFLEEALRAEWFAEELLFDEDGGYVLPPADQDMEDETGAAVDAGASGDFEPEKDWLRLPYKSRNGFICVNSEGEWEPICGVFDVVGRSANADGTDSAGRIISFVNENGKRVELTLSLAQIYGDANAILTMLASRGLKLACGGRQQTARLAELLQSITPRRLISTVPSAGFIRDENGDITSFMTPTGVHLTGGRKVPPVRLYEGTQVEVVKARGTLAGWQVAASAASAQADANPHFLLSLCAGFAGPLMGILNISPCGITLSGRTSKGKTLSQTLGASVWASPQAGHGLLFGSNTTSNAMEDLALRGNEAVLMMDEIGAMGDKKALEALLFQIAQGRSKARKSGRDMGLSAGCNFSTFVVFSSENGLRNEIKSAGGHYRAGMSARFCDVDVTTGATVDSSVIAELESVKVNYGHAGADYVEHLLKSAIDPARLQREIDVIAASLTSASNSAMLRAARVFALAQRGGELACEADILSDVEAVRTAVKNCWIAFAGSEEAGATSNDSLLDKVTAFLNGHLDLRIIGEGSDNSESRGRAIGWYDDEYIYLDWALLDNPAALGIDFIKREELCKVLHEAGALDKPAKGFPHSKLPAVFGRVGVADGRSVKNLRIKRGVLGI